MTGCQKNEEGAFYLLLPLMAQRHILKKDNHTLAFSAHTDARLTFHKNSLSLTSSKSFT